MQEYSCFHFKPILQISLTKCTERAQGDRGTFESLGFTKVVKESTVSGRSGSEKLGKFEE